MYCYDFSLVLPARPFRNKIWTQRKILKLWEMHDFERRQDGTVGTVVFFFRFGGIWFGFLERERICLSS